MMTPCSGVRTSKVRTCSFCTDPASVVVHVVDSRGADVARVCACRQHLAGLRRQFHGKGVRLVTAPIEPKLS
jgi:hypothetical protein